MLDRSCLLIGHPSFIQRNQITIQRSSVHLVNDLVSIRRTYSYLIVSHAIIDSELRDTSIEKLTGFTKLTAYRCIIKDHCEDKKVSVS